MATTITLPGNITEVLYNTTSLDKVIYNTTNVWQKTKEGYVDSTTTVDTYVPYTTAIDTPYITVTPLPYYGSVTFATSSESRFTNLEYSTNLTTWTSINKSFSLSFATPIYLRGTGNSQVEYLSFTGGKAKVTGNVASLLDYQNMGTFRIYVPGLFQNCTSLMDASGLLIKYSDCYMGGIFYGCTSLMYPPLQMTYEGQTYFLKNAFYNCTSLKKTPILAATTAVSNGYESMFYNCTALTAAPELPATTLASSCYRSMFEGCSNMDGVIDLPATTAASYCYYRMFYGFKRMDGFVIHIINSDDTTWCKDMFASSINSAYVTRNPNWQIGDDTFKSTAPMYSQWWFRTL